MNSLTLWFEVAVAAVSLYVCARHYAVMRRQTVLVKGRNRR